MSHRCADVESPNSDHKMDISETPTNASQNSSVNSPADDLEPPQSPHAKPADEAAATSLDNRLTAADTRMISPTIVTPKSNPTLRSRSTSNTTSQLNTSLSTLTLSNDSHPLMFDESPNRNDDDDDDDLLAYTPDNRPSSRSYRTHNNVPDCGSAAGGTAPLRLAQPLMRGVESNASSGARPKTTLTTTTTMTSSLQPPARSPARSNTSSDNDPYDGPDHDDAADDDDDDDNSIPDLSEYETSVNPVHQSVSLHSRPNTTIQHHTQQYASNVRSPPPPQQQSQQRRIPVDAALLSDDDDVSSIDTSSPQHSFDEDDDDADGDDPRSGGGGLHSTSITSSMMDEVAGAVAAATTPGAAAAVGSSLRPQKARKASGGGGGGGGVSPIPPYLAVDEARDTRYWRHVTLANGQSREIDMRVIEPFQRVLSHGGYLSTGGCNAIVVFSACHLPDKGRRDYQYVMNNLFLYVVKTLEQLVTDDYVLVYMHGGASRHNAPQFTWLKSCYQLLDRRLRKSLRTLYIVHPSLWLKSMVVLLRPFTSRKFWKKVVYVKSLEELYTLVPLEKAAVPEKVKRYDEKYI